MNYTSFRIRGIFYKISRLVTVSWFLSAVFVLANAVPLKQRIVDLTHVFDENTISYPISRNPAKFILKENIVYPKGVRVKAEDLSEGTHAGTHLDAPLHFYPGTASVADIPLEQLSGPAAIVDISSRALSDQDAEMTVEDLINWEQQTGQTLNDTIVIMRCGYSKFYSDKEAFVGTAENDITKVRHPGVSPEAALWLVTNRKVKGVGTDSLSIDRGITTGYQSHKILLGAGLFLIECVANLDDLPLYGATVDVTPMKLAKAGGAPVRIVAKFPEVIFNQNKSEF